MHLIKRFPENILELKPYVAGKTIEEVKEHYKPERIAKLASNENRLGYSKSVENTISRAAKNLNNYPDPSSEDLREAIAQRNRISKDEILVAAGSESIISILCRTCFKPGENAVTANATFVGFFVQAGVIGIDIQKVSVTDNYKFDVDGILNSINDQTTAVYIANPNNPTGTYIHQSEYEKLIDGVPDDVLIIMDEAYYEYAKGVVDYPDVLNSPSKNVIILRTFSKAYGLAGLRIGYAIADKDIITQMMKTKLTFEPTALAQAAALAAYGDQQFIEQSVDTVVKGREKLYNFFDSQNVKYCRSVSNSVMMILENEQDASKFTQKMLEKGVILRQIDAFGLPNCVRITIGTEADMDHFENAFTAIN